jgi:hypothetical protein
MVALFALVVALSPVARAEEENPLKKAKVGDFAKYKMTMSILGMDISMDTIVTVSQKDDKEATLETEVKAPAGFPVPQEKQKTTVDLTKPLDPTKNMNLPAGTKAKLDKLKSGSEKIKLGGKEYDCTWETYKMKVEQGGMEVEGNIKVWNAKNFAFGSVKMEMTMEIQGQKMEMKMEMTDTGSKK